VADVAAAQGLWLHADAAWGGAAALVPELRGALAGIERADSVTLDAHKWLSVPMAAGMFLTRRRDALPRAFAISAAYVPPNEAGDTVDPYAHSMQWSRRFIGLKLFLSLAVAGWEGYAAALRHQTAMGDLLRAELVRGGWRVINETPLPVVCFEDTTGADADAVVRAVVASGDAWVSSTRVGAGRPALRACVTSYRTGPEDVRTLVRALDDARRRVRVGTPRATSSEAAPRLDLTAP
jgi:glutamate/tyrosine decarboxylase-like PLP-dependent enzyme